jgi:hypothetical protein
MNTIFRRYIGIDSSAAQTLTASLPGLHPLAAVHPPSAVAEVYPSLWRRGFALKGRTADQRDAFRIAAWHSRADRDRCLWAFLNPTVRRPSGRWRSSRTGYWAFPA